MFKTLEKPRKNLIRAGGKNEDKKTAPPTKKSLLCGEKHTEKSNEEAPITRKLNENSSIDSIQNAIGVFSSTESRDILILQLQAIIRQHEEMPDYRKKFCLSNLSVAGVFKMGKEYGSNEIVKFQALEIYNQYVAVCNNSIQDEVDHMDSKTIEEFQQRVSDQVLLRISTCFLIAHKVNKESSQSSAQTELSSLQIRSTLKKFGKSYSNSAIVKSEKRILTTLQYRARFPTCSDLLQIVNTFNVFYDDDINLHKVFHFSIKLLELFYLRYTFILNYYNSQRGKSKQAEVNYIDISLIAGAVFICAVHIVHPSHKLPPVKSVSELLAVPGNYLSDISTVLISEIFNI